VNQSSPFAVRTVIILVIGGALLLLASILMSGFGDELSRAVGDAPAADRKDGSGYHAFKRLVDAVQPPGRNDADTLNNPAIVILTPTNTTRPEDVKTIVDRRISLANAAMEDSGDDEPFDRYPTLIILPKWQTEAIPLGGGKVRRTGTVDMARI